MKVELKLFATLMPYLPPGAKKNAVTVEVEPGCTMNQLISRYRVPREEVHLVLLNGHFVNENGRGAPLREGDTLAIWPPVAGG
ncbi:MAG: MoaD/ThiS family protein [Gammaproteobacteria bacterium]|nr:MoaD/ThiS family protein [Gammaproteobacteria bacterium]MXY66839.1 MoaD/ThiS family protein [Gammaproteobacteria bacterium]MYG67915.1 MoaD/ThiS family protein [Gammaproteobacteria bacterium]MYH91506.1 MoaD/ThiS family protein [Gammaproteobacteria bacterium]